MKKAQFDSDAWHGRLAAVQSQRISASYAQSYIPDIVLQFLKPLRRTRRECLIAGTRDMNSWHICTLFIQ